METKPMHAGTARPLAVLVVEDNPVNQTLVAHMLECMGHVPTFAEHGAQALEMAANHSFDAILMDMQMPVMDGETATRLIRLLPGDAAAVPVIALTADCSSDHAELVESGQLDAFLSKPVSLEVLAGTLERVTRGRAEEPAPQAPAALPPAEADGASPALDPAYLEDMRQWVGDDTLLALLAAAPPSLRAELTGLAGAWLAGDWHRVRELAHRLKGAAGSVGARRLSTVAHAVQKMEPKDFPGSQALDELATELEAAAAALLAWRPPG